MIAGALLAIGGTGFAMRRKMPA
ncbi:MprA protease, GlyGly-CTERM protein-sorting domain-containing form [Bradyrhizobium sp. USDA 4011]